MTSEDNDIRAALGTLVHNTRAIAETVGRLEQKMDDIGVVADRGARLVQVVEDADALLDMVPGALRELGNDPTFGAFLGPVVDEWATDMERIIAARRAARTQQAIAE